MQKLKCAVAAVVLGVATQGFAEGFLPVVGSGPVFHWNHTGLNWRVYDDGFFTLVRSTDRWVDGNRAGFREFTPQVVVDEVVSPTWLRTAGDGFAITNYEFTGPGSISFTGDTGVITLYSSTMTMNVPVFAAQDLRILELSGSTQRGVTFNKPVALGQQGRGGGGTLIMDGGVATIGGNQIFAPETAVSLIGGHLEVGVYSQTLASLSGDQGSELISTGGDVTVTGELKMNGRVRVSAPVGPGKLPATVSAAVLNGGAGSLYQPSAVILDNAFLQVGTDDGVIGTFTGGLQEGPGNGSLFKVGNNLQILLGTGILHGAVSAPAYSVLGGTLAGNTGNIGNSIYVATGATLLLNQQTDGTLGGRLSGPGILLVSGNGGGVLTLTGSNAVEELAGGVVKVNRTANEHTGGTQINFGGTLAISNDDQLGTLVAVGPGVPGTKGEPGVPVVTRTYSPLMLEGGTLVTSAGIASSRTISVSGMGGRLTRAGRLRCLRGA